MAWAFFGVVRLDMLCAGVVVGARFLVGWSFLWRGAFSGVLTGECLGAWFCSACLSWLVFFVCCRWCGRGRVVVCVCAVLFHQ